MILFRFIFISLFLISIAACDGKEENKTATAESASQQHMNHTETSSDVPALHQFHEVIYQIWHKAWPEKNTQLLKDLIPQIESGFANLRQASLPGILQDKQEAWTKGIQDMAGIIESYKKNAAADQKEALLTSAEDLHSQFEQLVRLIRPVTKEIDHFHQELYMLYHNYMPAYDLEKINASTTELIIRIDAVEKAEIPARLKNNQQAYKQAVTSLRDALLKLQQTLKEKAEKAQVIGAIEMMHDKYQQLIAVCE